ncbi:MAG TPA: CAP domain-containing protein [Planctomycetota bacterium]|nr:CAP domain-containing protein [Planctomycetota bacterium]HRR79460.1 CAP domain-containing protein [Planctomycetota bacterium]HRT95273.1 CAP domain-containing protein [Planctomycetota bacterium]
MFPRLLHVRSRVAARGALALGALLAAALRVASVAPAAGGEASSPAQAFVRALESATATPEQRAEAWKALTEGDKKPPRAVAEALDRARERAWQRLASAVGSLGSLKPLAGLRGALGPHQAKARDFVNGNAFSKEKLDEVMAPIQKAFDEAMAAVGEAEKYKALRASVHELEGYAVQAGLRHGWSEELWDQECALVVVNRFAGSPRHSSLIETNQLVGGWIDPGEAACIARLNVHRLLIGLAPMEIDLRLVIAGKKHSEEMVAKKYFAHDSPTESLKTPWMRAGREQTGSNGECIAGGQSTGVGAFTGWYYSQGHHKIMISGGACVGVGRAGSTWTLMVGGSRITSPRTDKMATYVRRRYEAGERAEALFELAKWCASVQLLTQAQDELERVVALDPNHEAAKKALERLRARKP